MTTRAVDGKAGSRRFVLAPNIAPNWGQTVRIYLVLSAGVLGVALVCTAMGFWPVLPFAGIEISVLGWALYVSARRSLDREMVTVEQGMVRIEKGRGRVERAWDMEQAWTEVIHRQLPRRWEETELVLRSRGREVKLGSFLEPEERRSLARELRRCIGPMARCGDDGALTAVPADRASMTLSVGPSHSLGDRTG